MARFTIVAALFYAFAPFVLVQSSYASDPQAQTLAARATAALTGGITVSDVSLTASVTTIAGSDTQTGTATFSANGSSASRVDFNLSGGSRSEVRGAPGGTVRGMWSRASATAKPLAEHNSWTDTSWFFPAFSSLTVANPNCVFTYIGQETRDGLQVQHVRVFQHPPQPPGISKIPASVAAHSPTVEHLSAMDFYLDSQSLLPLAVTFNIHPDDDANTDIPAEIRFADYRVVNGVQVPFHIQRLVNNGLVMDILVSQATLNSGLPGTQFSLQ